MSYTATRAQIADRFDHKGIEPEKELRREIGKQLSRTVFSLVRSLEPELILEVGAYEAGFSAKMRRFMPDARIVAFEADPVAYEAHRESVLERQIDYRHECVSDKEGTIAFKVPVKNGVQVRTMGSMLADTVTRDYVSFDVAAVTLDSIYQGESKAALWVDVEGGIGPVLAGGSKVLQNTAVLYAEVERHRRWNDQQIDTEVIEQLDRFGLTPVARDAQRYWQYNLLFIRPEFMTAESKRLIGDYERFVEETIAASPGPQSG